MPTPQGCRDRRERVLVDRFLRSARSFAPFPGEITVEPGKVYEFRVITKAGPTQGRISKFDVLVDRPDIVANFEDQQTGTGEDPVGVLTLDVSGVGFTSVVQVIATLQGSTADGLRVVSKSATQVLIHTFLNAVLTDSTVDVLVRGY